jgi:hypothetical protein
MFCFICNRLLISLSHALQSSGVDLSQTSISVQINLGKRAGKRSASAGGVSSNSKVKYPNHMNGWMFMLVYKKTVFQQN